MRTPATVVRGPVRFRSRRAPHMVARSLPHFLACSMVIFLSLLASHVAHATPPTVIEGGPSTTTTDTGAIFTFHGSTGNSTFTCQLDGGAVTGCSSPMSYGGLTVGDHTFVVQATNSSGSADDPAVHAWIVVTYEVLHEFAAGETATPFGALVIGPNGDLYGTTTAGTATPQGAVFRLAPDGSGFTVVVSFDGSNGSSPYGGLVRGADGHLYGTTSSGGGTAADAGVIFKLDVTSGPQPAFSVLHVFPNDATGGGHPLAGLVESSVTPGVFFGTTYTGGAGLGTIFRLDARPGFDPSVVTLYHFDGAQGAHPQAPLVSILVPGTPPDIPDNEILHGTTYYGGPDDVGVAFEFDVNGGSISELDALTGPNGANPVAGVTRGPDGTFYGVTQLGGATSQGVVFKLDAGGVTVVHAFDAGGVAQTGAFPLGTLLGGADGRLYGTAYDGGPRGRGTIFLVDPLGRVLPVHAFDGTAGGNPRAALISDANGSLYGTTESGGSGGGVVFRLSLAPDTIIDSGPDPSTSSTDATFAFTATQTGATYTCELDGQSVPCTNPMSFHGRAPGSHTFTVRAISRGGHGDPTPATYTWTVVNVNPIVTIDGAPPALTNSTGATFAFHADGTLVFIECQLDGSAFVACASPTSYTGLSEGSHTFVARASDPYGGVGVASYTWTVDTTPPDTVISSRPAASTSSASATFAFHATEAGSVLACRLDGGAFEPCASPTTYPGLAPGSHTFQVAATDLAGNADATPASHGWTVLVVPPGPGPEDPGAIGPLAVNREDYDFGDTAFTPPSGFPGDVEVRASVHYPTTLAGGPLPLVVFLHGRHVTCFADTEVFLQWPCSTDRLPVESHRGYDYAADVLASHGYIVVSISANGISVPDNNTADLGMQARADLVQHHLDLWQTFNTTGGEPFGTKFVGRVDMTRIGMMGHSRGGEGMVRHFLHNESLGSPHGIKAVLALAPTNFGRLVINNVPLSVVLPYCDGDISDLEGVHFFDDARYNAAGDRSPKYTLLVMGANHNFYNVVWTPSGPGASDDWRESSDPHCGTAAGTGRLTDAQQRGTAIAFLSAFFRVHVGGATGFHGILKGDAPIPASATTSNLHRSYHAPDDPLLRLDVNRLLDASALTVNTLGGTVSRAKFTPYDLCGGAPPEPVRCITGSSRRQEPHTSTDPLRGVSALRGGWSATGARYTNTLPAGSRDVSNFLALQFRVSTNFGDSRNPVGAAQDFSVVLTDGTGASSAMRVSDRSGVLYYPPGGSGEAGSALPKVVLNTARIPLSAFSGINLADVRTIVFRFDQRASGAFLFSDIAFVDRWETPRTPADLTETSVSNPPAAVARLEKFTVSDTVVNQGQSTAGASTTRYFLSPDTIRDSGDTLLTASRAVPALAGGVVSTGSVTVTVPGTVPAGLYFLLACSDEAGVVAESDETNNCRASATQVRVRLADLIISAVGDPPLSMPRGSTFTAMDTTQNAGDGDAKASTTRYYLSLDSTKSTTDRLLTGSRAVPLLVPGAHSEGTAAVTIPSTTPTGSYFLLACTDDLKKVAESAEGNNCLSSPAKVTVTP